MRYSTERQPSLKNPLVAATLAFCALTAAITVEPTEPLRAADRQTILVQRDGIYMTVPATNIMNNDRTNVCRDEIIITIDAQEIQENDLDPSECA